MRGMRATRIRLLAMVLAVTIGAPAPTAADPAPITF